MGTRVFVVLLAAVAAAAAQNTGADRPVVTLGITSAKRGDAVPIRIPSGETQGAQVTLGGRPVAAEIQGKTLVVDVPKDQPLGPAEVVVTVPGHRFPARDSLTVLATSAGPGIDSIRPFPLVPKDGLTSVKVFGHDFSTSVLEMPNDIKLLVDQSQKDIQWRTSAAEADKACEAARSKKASDINGAVVSASEIYFCNVPAAKNGVLSLGLYQGGEVPSRADTTVVSDWNGWMIRGVAMVIAGLLVGLVYFLLSFKGAHIVKDRRYRLRAMFLDKQTNTYSLSILQFHAWTAATLFGYTYFALARLLVQRALTLPDAPSGVPAIVGIGVGATTAVAAQLIQGVNPKGSGDEVPSPSDLVTSGGAVAPDRVQMLVWTLVSVFVFLVGVLVQEPSAIKELPSIPQSLMALMGLSSLGYLGGKYARKPGPNILELSIIPSTALPAGGSLTQVAPVDVTEPKSTAAQVLESLKSAAKGLSEPSAPAAVRQATAAVSALESAVAAAGASGSSGVSKLIELADTSHNAAMGAAAEFDRSAGTAGSEVARVSANIAQRASTAVQDLRASVGSLVSTSEAAAARRTAEESRAFRRTVEFRGSNLSAEGVFRAKVGDNEYDLPFRMLEERDGVRAPQIVVPEEASGNAKFCRTLRLNIIPAKLDAADKKAYDAVFGKCDTDVTFTIFNPDGQKATKTVKLPPGEAQRQ